MWIYLPGHLPHRHSRRHKRKLLLEELEQRQLLTVDFGDAPDPLFASAGNYPTRRGSDGTRHTVVEGSPFLGSTAPDSEPDAEQREREIEIVNAGFDLRGKSLTTTHG